MPVDWRTRLAQFLPSWGEFGLGVVIFLITFTGSIALTAFVLVRLPADYFRGPSPHFVWAERHPVLRWTWRIGKNVGGVLLILAGIIMSLPGVPGQGILTILFGVMLIDFPGKRKLEQRIVRWPRVRNAIDRLRARFGRPPLVLDD